MLNTFKSPSELEKFISQMKFFVEKRLQLEDDKRNEAVALLNRAQSLGGDIFRIRSLIAKQFYGNTKGFDRGFVKKEVERSVNTSEEIITRRLEELNNAIREFESATEEEISLEDIFRAIELNKDLTNMELFNAMVEHMEQFRSHLIVPLDKIKKIATEADNAELAEDAEQLKNKLNEFVDVQLRFNEIVLERILRIRHWLDLNGLLRFN